MAAKLTEQKRDDSLAHDKCRRKGNHDECTLSFSETCDWRGISQDVEVGPASRFTEPGDALSHSGEIDKRPEMNDVPKIVHVQETEAPSQRSRLMDSKMSKRVILILVGALSFMIGFAIAFRALEGYGEQEPNPYGDDFEGRFAPAPVSTMSRSFSSIDPVPAPTLSPTVQAISSATSQPVAGGTN